jgi:hypothetical protein
VQGANDVAKKNKRRYSGIFQLVKYYKEEPDLHPFYLGVFKLIISMVRVCECKEAISIFSSELVDVFDSLFSILYQAQMEPQNKWRHLIILWEYCVALNEDMNVLYLRAPKVLALMDSNIKEETVGAALSGLTLSRSS